MRSMTTPEAGTLLLGFSNSMLSNSMLVKLVRFFTKPVSDEQLLAAYKDAGAQYGDACSYAMMGEVLGIRQMRVRWSKLERECAARGYKPVDIKRFIELGGYDQPIDDVFPVRLEDGEDPTLYDPQPPKSVPAAELVGNVCDDCRCEVTDDEWVFCRRCLRRLLKPIEV